MPFFRTGYKKPFQKYHLSVIEGSHQLPEWSEKKTASKMENICRGTLKNQNFKNKLCIYSYCLNFSHF